MAGRSSPSRLAPGERLGEFTIRGMLGKGENAEVYRATHPDYRRDVAVKVFHPDITRTESLTPVFKQQTRDIINLKHPNITRVLDAGIAGDSYYLVMELIAGTTLRDEVSLHPKGFARHDALRLFRQIASAVAYAHDQNVLHGNIKPDNVLLDRTQRPILTDFNIPCFREHPSGRGGAASPVYLAPEQITVRTLVTPQSDIYALGILLYEIVTGDVPFKAATFSEIAQLQLKATPHPPGETNVGIDPRVENTIMAALHKEPDQRFKSVRDMLASLEGDVDSDPYETVTFTRDDLEKEKKKRAAEIRQFERARVAGGDSTAGKDMLPHVQSQLVMTVLAATAIIILVLVILLA